MRLPLFLTLALLAPLVQADIFATYSITGTVATSTIAGISPGDEWAGTLETFDNCTVCRTDHLDFDFTIIAFGHGYRPSAADFPSSTTFDTVALSLGFIESDGPYFILDDHSFLYSPAIRDTAHRVSGTVDIDRLPEPESILLLLTAIAVLGVLSRRFQQRRS